LTSSLAAARAKDALIMMAISSGCSAACRPAGGLRVLRDLYACRSRSRPWRMSRRGIDRSSSWVMSEARWIMDGWDTTCVYLRKGRIMVPWRAAWERDTEDGRRVMMAVVMSGVYFYFYVLASLDAFVPTCDQGNGMFVSCLLCWFNFRVCTFSEYKQ
jgi:hypothetical protein